ncbi:uncharacterized protein [Palaemon carinicauda]|uniref:uncharacterized protein n=1 Tax=Palaemon carinicauda TaxID=392227 RepID=UPI0035B58BDA
MHNISTEVSHWPACRKENGSCESAFTRSDLQYRLEEARLSVTPEVWAGAVRQSRHFEEEYWESDNIRETLEPVIISLASDDEDGEDDLFLESRPAALRDTTNPDWAPSVKLGHDKNTTSPCAADRYQRKRLRTERIAEELAAAALLDLGNIEAKGDGDSKSVEVQTDLTSETIIAMQEEINRLMDENKILKEKIDQLTLNEDFFQGNDESVSFYTGLLNFLILMHVLNFMSPYLTVTGRTCLPKFQQFIATLMKYRLNLKLQDLAYRFSVSMPTMSRYFNIVTNILYARIQFLVKWPSRDELRKAMPMCFHVSFGNKVAVILDCFEVFIDRPSNLMARAQTWSSYKHHITVKFLIGITPQGVISYISPAWGGRVSDKYLTENCGFMDNLLPGDVLADRGFDISDSISLRCATVKIPAFLRGKKQLSASEVFNTRKIANVRIHVERVIGCVRQRYSILNGPMPLDFLTCSGPGKKTLVDKLVVICCALNNLSPPVVKFD